MGTERLRGMKGECGDLDLFRFEVFEREKVDVRVALNCGI
jgi:hypothetical protein